MNYTNAQLKLISTAKEQKRAACMKAHEEQRALDYAEWYGITSYKIKDGKMIYYTSWHYERTTYKCIVNLDTMEETREPMTRYYKPNKKIGGLNVLYCMQKKGRGKMIVTVCSLEEVETSLICPDCIRAIQSRGEKIFTGDIVQRWEYEDEGKEFKCVFCGNDYLVDEPNEKDELIECIW